MSSAIRLFHHGFERSMCGISFIGRRFPVNPHLKAFTVDIRNMSYVSSPAMTSLFTAAASASNEESPSDFITTLYFSSSVLFKRRR